MPMIDRADIIEAFEAAVGRVPIIAAVYDYLANVAPPSGKVTAEITLIGEGENTRVNGGRPNNGLFSCPIRVGVRLTASVPRDMDSKQFERTVVKPVQNAIEAAPEVAALDNEVFLEGIQWEAYQDGKSETLSADMIWKLTYQHIQNAS